MEAIELTPVAAAAIERTHAGRIRLASRRGRNHSVVLALGVLCTLTFVGFVRMDFGTVDLGRALAQTWSDFCAMMFQPALDPPLGAAHFSWAKVAESTLVTIAVTVLCTIISAIISFFLALAASENLSNPLVSNAVKGFVAIIRAIPTILWVLVFTVAIGLGYEAAVLGISFHSIAHQELFGINRRDRCRCNRGAFCERCQLLANRVSGHLPCHHHQAALVDVHSLRDQFCQRGGRRRLCGCGRYRLSAVSGR